MDTRARTLDMLRERRERLVRELAELDLAEGGISAREWLTWQTRLAELDSRIARYSHS